EPHIVQRVDDRLAHRGARHSKEMSQGPGDGLANARPAIERGIWILEDILDQAALLVAAVPDGTSQGLRSQPDGAGLGCVQAADGTRQSRFTAAGDRKSAGG